MSATTSCRARCGTVSLGSGRRAVAISGGYDYACALLDNGRVRCWGDNPQGQLGYGNSEDIGDNELPSTAGPVNLGRRALSISVGWEHACVLLDNGRIRCWARNGEGQLGLGNTDVIGDNEAPATAPFAAAGGLVPTKVSPGMSMTIRPKRDRSSPFRAHVSGRLTGFIGDSATCNAAVLVRATNGSQDVSKRARLRPAAGGCSFRTSLATGFGTWTIRARFAGNGSLRARNSAGKQFRAG